MNDMLISVCPFNNGEFDVILIDRETGDEVTLSGHQKLSEEEFAIVNKLAPSCVFTRYKQVVS